MDLVHSSSLTRKAALALALGAAALAALALPALGTGAPRAAAVGACPSFRVLHNDRIGPASLPAGSYEVTPAAGSGLSCAAASRLFTRFLEDYDGVLPRPWRVVAQGSGKATFTRGSARRASRSPASAAAVAAAATRASASSAPAPTRSTPAPRSARSSSHAAST